ncbi:MAG: response regulator [Verrucomicrobiota bacterium]
MGERQRRILPHPHPIFPDYASQSPRALLSAGQSRHSRSPSFIHPSARSPRPPPTPLPTPSPSHRPTPKALAPRVLVLDDEEAICMLITCALSPHGYEVTEALDGMTAIAHYKEAIAIGRPFDLVISDLTLPEGLSGAETISQLRAIDPFIRAIVSSGQTHDPILTRFEDYGFTDRITKPYQLRDLVAKVASVLNSSATPDQRKKFGI